MAKKLCFIVGEMGATKTPERETAGWLMGEIVEPVLKENFPDFELRHVDIVLEQEHINKEILDNLTHAELVIANISGATPLMLYQVGIRHAIGLPIILMASTRNRPIFDLKENRYIAFKPRGGVIQARAALKAEIERVLAEVALEPTQHLHGPVPKRTLTESCPQNGDVPKSPLPKNGQLDAVGRHEDKLTNRSEIPAHV